MDVIRCHWQLSCPQISEIPYDTSINHNTYNFRLWRSLSDQSKSKVMTSSKGQHFITCNHHNYSRRFHWYQRLRDLYYWKLYAYDWIVLWKSYLRRSVSLNQINVRHPVSIPYVSSGYQKLTSLQRRYLLPAKFRNLQFWDNQKFWCRVRKTIEVLCRRTWLEGLCVNSVYGNLNFI